MTNSHCLLLHLAKCIIEIVRYHIKMKEVIQMLYMDFQDKVAALGYRAELDRIMVTDGGTEHYAQKNRVHIFADDQPAAVAKIFEFEAAPEMDDHLDPALVTLIQAFANTPIDERGIQDVMPATANLRQ